jgi:hypothetical protein
MKKAQEEALKEAEEARTEAAAARGEADAAKAELAELKGKMVDGEVKTEALIPVAAPLPSRSRGPIHYPQLTSTNYILWVMQMRVAMQSA